MARTKQTGRKKNSGNKPRSARPANWFYQNSKDGQRKRSNIKNKSLNVTVKELAVLMTAHFSSLSEEEQAPFNVQAEQDKVRADKESTAFALQTTKKTTKKNKNKKVR